MTLSAGTYLQKRNSVTTLMNTRFEPETKASQISKCDLSEMPRNPHGCLIVTLLQFGRSNLWRGSWTIGKNRH